MEKRSIKFYIDEDGEMAMAVLEVAGKKHYTCDIRTPFKNPDTLTVCISNTTLSDKYWNEEEVSKLVRMEIWREEVKEVEVVFEDLVPFGISHVEITNPFKK